MNGRSAIVLALRALGVGPGDRFLVPTYHCPTMVEPAVRLGAEPVFYSIDTSGACDLDYLRTIDTRGVKAMLAVHFFGVPQELAAVRAFCDERDVALIEDCAHAFFGHSASAAIGSVGDMAIASCPKFFPTVDGGCLVVRTDALRSPVLRSPNLIDQLRAAWDMLELGATAGRLGWMGPGLLTLAWLKSHARGHAVASQAQQAGEPDLSAACNTIDLRLTDRQAAAATRWTVRHANTQRIIEARRANYLEFAKLLSQHQALRPLIPQLPDGAVPYVFPLEVDDPETLYRALRHGGVPLYRWDLVWPGTPALPGDAGAHWSRHVFQLALHQDMSTTDVAEVASFITSQASRSRA